MKIYQKEFAEFLVRTGALQFGEFRLKSGRISPYFFNSGQFNLGSCLERLGYYYACAVQELEISPNLIFGPAYKGIPLCVTTAIALKTYFKMDVHYSFDRKEVKKHGEGGWLVGKTPINTDRLVLVDDVITDGTTKREMITRLQKKTNAEITGLVIAFDRKEKNSAGGNSLTALSISQDLEVRSIITIYDILTHLTGRRINGQLVLKKNVQKQIESYLEQHGIN